jgi:hypothetical protein
VLIDRVIEAAKGLGWTDETLVTAHIVRATFGIGYRISWAAYLIGLMEKNLDLHPGPNLTLDQRLSVINSAAAIERVGGRLNQLTGALV